VTMNLEFFQPGRYRNPALYQAARQQSPVGVMFQLGQTAGQMVGVYLKSMIPDVPEFDDSGDTSAVALQKHAGAGTVDDEVVVAFG